jgi:predicted nucleic acid-binding protein
MAVICDTGAVYALYDADDAHHQSVRAQIEAEFGPFLLPVILLAEIDYLLTARLGAKAAIDFVESIEQGSFELVLPEPSDLTRIHELMTTYGDLRLGIADASVVATAERLNVDRILTLDHRHFRVIQPRGMAHFVLLPTDRT